MKTDNIFYRLFQEFPSTAGRLSKVTHSKVKSIIYQGFCLFEMVALFPPRFTSIFFELIGEPPESANTYKFSSIEIKQTSFRIDGVFLPKIEDENTTYFVEVQFQSDSEIYSRLFSEIGLYLRQYQPKNDWRAVVIHPTRSLDTGDIKHYQEYFASGRVSRIYIDAIRRY